MTKPKAQQEKEAAASKRGRGRPSVFDQRLVKLVRPLAALGWTEIQMAEALDVSLRSFQRFKADNPEFLAAATSTESERLEAVKRSLYHRAMGYSHPAVKIMTVSVGGGVSEVVREEYVEHYPPDVSAIQFFLKNRDPANWKDRQEVQQSGDVVVRVEGGLPDKEPPQKD